MGFRDRQRGYYSSAERNALTGKEPIVEVSPEQEVLIKVRNPATGEEFYLTESEYNNSVGANDSSAKNLLFSTDGLTVPAEAVVRNAQAAVEQLPQKESFFVPETGKMTITRSLLEPSIPITKKRGILSNLLSDADEANVGMGEIDIDSYDPAGDDSPPIQDPITRNAVRQNTSSSILESVLSPNTKVVLSPAIKEDVTIPADTNNFIYKKGRAYKPGTIIYDLLDRDSSNARSAVAINNLISMARAEPSQRSSMPAIDFTNLANNQPDWNEEIFEPKSYLAERPEVEAEILRKLKGDKSKSDILNYLLDSTKKAKSSTQDYINEVDITPGSIELVGKEAEFAGNLLNNKLVRFGLAGAGGVGLLALIASAINQNKERKQEEVSQMLNYPVK